MRYLLSLIALFTLTLTGCQSTLSTSSEGSFDTLLDEIWQYEQNAQSGGRGVTAGSSLPNISPEFKAQRHAKLTAFIEQVNAFSDTELTEQQQISKAIQLYRLQNYVDEYQYHAHLMPITSEYGFHSSLLNLRYRFAFTQPSDFEQYLDLLEQIPEYMAQQIDYMRQGITLGKTQPQVVLDGFEESIATIIKADPMQSAFFVPFTQVSDAALVARAKHVILTSVNPAFQAFYDFMVEEYKPNAKVSIAAKDWPNGAEYYQNRVRYYTTLDLSAAAIHEIGLQEVARIRGQMQEVLDELNYVGSINDFIAFLRSDPQFYATTSKELIHTAMVMSKRMDALLPKLFEHLPRTPYGVAPVPDDIAPKYTTGRYVSPRNDQQPGYYWVNTYALDKRPLYALPALTLHEAVPGHHLQISLANEMQDLPNVRRSTYISAFGEGWGLYSEYLGVEVGFYQTPYEEFGRLSYEMWRACRLVVDTGMHMLGWTRQQALDYMLENTALSAHNVKTEIDRYISWPGQALAYKLGEILIKKWRVKSQEALGTGFDVRRFHTAVLKNGSVPLHKLERQLEQFIEDEQARLKQL
jgi:uncharacterized protein (DUF885 family)